MPATLDVSCPKCGKKLRVPAEFEGKRVKCKDCQEAFPVKASGAAAQPTVKPAPAAKGPVAPATNTKAAPKPEPKPEEKKSPFLDDDDEDVEPGKAAKPLDVVKEDDSPRCPHCTKELDPPDAVICIHCGFNNMTRTKAETTKVTASDTSDWVSHLAPGIIALVVAILLIILDIYCIQNMRGWMEGGMLETDEVDMTGKKKMILPPGALILVILVMTVPIIIPCLKFAFTRLVLKYRPPEKVRK